MERLCVMADERLKRSPFKPTKIKDLENTQGRVALVGVITSKNKDLSSFMLDDGDDQVLVLTRSVTDFDNIEEKQLVRVLGKIWGEGEEIEIQAEIIQDFSKIDKETYSEVFYK